MNLFEKCKYSLGGEESELTQSSSERKNYYDFNFQGLTSHTPS